MSDSFYILEAVILVTHQVIDGVKTQIQGRLAPKSIFFFVFLFSRATPMAYRGYQARSLIRVVAAGQHQSHSNTGSEMHLLPIAQLIATPDPSPTELGQG